MQVLHGAAFPVSNRTVWGFAHAEDAGVFRVTPAISLVQTVDFFPPPVDDPYLYGRIAAANSLSDVYAVGAAPITAVALLSLPRGKVPPEDVAGMFRGAADAFRESGSALLGRHSVQGHDRFFGFAVNV